MLPGSSERMDVLRSWRLKMPAKSAVLLIGSRMPTVVGLHSYLHYMHSSLETMSPDVQDLEPNVRSELKSNIFRLAANFSRYHASRVLNVIFLGVL